MIKRLDLRYTAIFFIIAAAIGGLISWLSSLPFWAAFTIVVVAMILNGIVAEFEDNLPGGFNNPTPEDETETGTERRKKRFSTKRIILWIVLAAILIWFAWLYWNKGK